MKILIADDHPIFRAGLKEFLGKEKDVKVIGEADNGRKALELVRKQRWDVVLLDLTMPGKDGLEVLQDLRRERPRQKKLSSGGQSLQGRYEDPVES